MAEGDVEKAGVGVLDDVRDDDIHVVPPDRLTALRFCGLQHHRHSDWLIDRLVYGLIHWWTVG